MPKKPKNEPAVFGEDLKIFGDDIQTLDGSPSIDQVEQEMITLPHPAGDLRYVASGIERRYVDARKVRDAMDTIGTIPGTSQATHLLLSGRVSLWNMATAILQLASPETITTLHIATLGYSRDNITELCALLDSGAIRNVHLLLSRYFKSTSTEIYNFSVSELGRRKQANILSVRNHAKLFAIQLSGGRTCVCEGSPNLRSCSQVEQVMLTGDPGLYAHHVQWINELFDQAAGQGVQP